MSARKATVNPADFTTDALYCAIAACRCSKHESDRRFAGQCRLELQRRMPIRRAPVHEHTLRRAA